MKKRHKTNCRCIACEQGMDALKKMEQDALQRCGWYVHYVTDDEYPYGLNAHTHGFPKKFGCHDLQIVAPISDKTAHQIFWSCVHLLEAGNMFQDGTVTDGILNDYMVKFVAARECGRDVLRLILPDRDGHLERKTIDVFFAPQYPDYAGTVARN